VIPGYWMNETSGVLRPAVEAYLGGAEMTGEQIAAMRAYLRQWIMADSWQGAAVDTLRAEVELLHNRATITSWLDAALEQNIDPL
jgi:hypothetical protein